MCPPWPSPFFRKINWQSSKIYQHITRLGDKLMQWGNQLCFCHWGATAQARTEPDELDHCESDFCGRCRDLCFYLDRGHKSEWVTSAVLPPLESHIIVNTKRMQHTHKVYMQVHTSMSTQKHEERCNKRFPQKKINNKKIWQRIVLLRNERCTKYCVER